MEVIIREIEVDDYPEVVSLWINALGIRKVNLEKFTVIMDKMNKAGNYKTFIALFENKVVGFISKFWGSRCPVNR